MIFDVYGELIKGMDIPENRKNDWRWLLRNLGIRNKDHPNFDKVMEIVEINLRTFES